MIFNPCIDMPAEPCDMYNFYMQFSVTHNLQTTTTTNKTMMINKQQRQQTTQRSINCLNYRDEIECFTSVFAENMRLSTEQFLSEELNRKISDSTKEVKDHITKEVHDSIGENKTIAAQLQEKVENNAFLAMQHFQCIESSLKDMCGKCEHFEEIISKIYG